MIFILSHFFILSIEFGNGFQIDTIQLSSILQRKITYAIILSGKRENSSIMVQTTSESPRNGSSGGFLFRFWIWWLKPQAGYRLFVTIQPFDDVVAGYTSHRQRHKTSHHHHCFGQSVSQPQHTCSGLEEHIEEHVKAQNR